MEVAIPEILMNYQYKVYAFWKYLFQLPHTKYMYICKSECKKKYVTGWL